MLLSCATKCASHKFHTNKFRTEYEVLKHRFIFSSFSVSALIASKISDNLGDRLPPLLEGIVKLSLRSFLEDWETQKRDPVSARSERAHGRRGIVSSKFGGISVILVGGSGHGLLCFTGGCSKLHEGCQQKWHWIGFEKNWIFWKMATVFPNFPLVWWNSRTPNNYSLRSLGVFSEEDLGPDSDSDSERNGFDKKDQQCCWKLWKC